MAGFILWLQQNNKKHAITHTGERVFAVNADAIQSRDELNVRIVYLLLRGCITQDGKAVSAWDVRLKREGLIVIIA